MFHIWNICGIFKEEKIRFLKGIWTTVSFFKANYFHLLFYLLFLSLQTAWVWMQYHKLAMCYFILYFIMQTDISFNHILHMHRWILIYFREKWSANEKTTLHLPWFLMLLYLHSTLQPAYQNSQPVGHLNQHKTSGYGISSEVSVCFLLWGSSVLTKWTNKNAGVWKTMKPHS